MIYDSRMVTFIGYFGFVLALTFGLISVSHSATYEGQWTKIILDKVNLDSLDLRGTAVLKGNELATQTHSVKIPLSASRIASLAKGIARGGVYGVILDQAMVAAGWVWDDILKNWKKTITVAPPSPDGVPAPSCFLSDGTLVRHDGLLILHGTNLFIQTIVQDCAPSTGCVSPGFFHNNCTNLGHCQAYFPALCLTPVPNTPTQQTVPASDKDIFDNGVKPNPDNTVRLVTGLPNVLNTPSQTMAKPGSVPMIHWPDIATLLSALVKAINDAKALFDAVAQAIKDGVASLSPDQLTHLTNNDIDISTLVQAISNVTNNVTLTEAQKAVLEKYNEKQTTTTTTITATAPTGSTEITIPTDCDLIPFVCDWLTWFKGWLTDDPPPIPDVIIPIKDLDEFQPMPTDTSGSCPSPYQYSLFGKPYQLSFQPWCDLATMISYLVIASAWLFASYIVLRVK